MTTLTYAQTKLYVAKLKSGLHRRPMFGRRAFYVAGPMAWNWLPDSL